MIGWAGRLSGWICCKAFSTLLNLLRIRYAFDPCTLESETRVRYYNETGLRGVAVVDLTKYL